MISPIIFDHDQTPFSPVPTRKSTLALLPSADLLHHIENLRVELAVTQEELAKSKKDSDEFAETFKVRDAQFRKQLVQLTRSSETMDQAYSDLANQLMIAQQDLEEQKRFDGRPICDDS